MLRKPFLQKIFGAYPSAVRYAFSHEQGRPCGSCGGQNLIMRFMCGDCHILQNPESTINKMNYFELFNL